MSHVSLSTLAAVFLTWRMRVNETLNKTQSAWTKSSYNTKCFEIPDQVSCWKKQIQGTTESAACSAPTHSFAELCVHHEVVDMFLSLGQLQLPGHHCNHQRSAASSLSSKNTISVSSANRKQSMSWSNGWEIQWQLWTSVKGQISHLATFGFVWC